jgi:antibiotic biosynthesis monooxygenase (ABM) superfamily enzyme
MTTPPRLADRITALAGSVDLSGLTPFLSPVMFSLNENSWPTMTLIMSLVAVLLITFVMVGWRKDLRRPTPSTRPTRP